MSTEERSKLAILVLSCDKYQDVWPVFEQSFKAAWPENQHTVYLLTNEIAAAPEFFKILSTGQDISWSDSLAVALKKIPEPFVLTVMDDAFWLPTLNVTALQRQLNECVASGNSYSRLSGSAPPVRSSPHLNQIPPSAMYRTSLHGAVWKKSVLNELLISGENAWQFEVIGTERSRRIQDFYASGINYLPSVHGIEKGIWLPEALAQLRSIGITPEIGQRKVMAASAKRSRSISMVAKSLAKRVLPAYARNKLHRLWWQYQTRKK
jgi:hypothetical protein